MLVTALPQVMSSHLQFRAVLDNAVIRLEMQKSSLKLNNIFVTVLRGADCLEPCWSLDLEYFGIVLSVEHMKITLEHPTGRFMVGVSAQGCRCSPALVRLFGTSPYRAKLPALGWLRGTQASKGMGMKGKPLQFLKYRKMCFESSPSSLLPEKEHAKSRQCLLTRL